MAGDVRPLSERLIDRLKNKRPIAYVVLVGALVGGVATFAEDISRLYNLASASMRLGAIPVVLPKDTGWIFAGYYDAGLNVYTSGPYVKTVRSPYPSADKLPRQGELLMITSERNIVIADFETQGLTRQLDPPWRQNVLKDSDYTGLKLPSGAVVEVRDVSIGAFPDKPAAVWVRVGSPK